MTETRPKESHPKRWTKSDKLNAMPKTQVQNILTKNKIAYQSKDSKATLIKKASKLTKAAIIATGAVSALGLWSAYNYVQQPKYYFKTDHDEQGKVIKHSIREPGKCKTWHVTRDPTTSQSKWFTYPCGDVKKGFYPVSKRVFLERFPHYFIKPFVL